MAMSYIRLYYSWPEQTQALSFEEKGRLVDCMMQYAQGGAWEELLTGNERFLFPVFKRQLDNAAAKYAQACAHLKNKDERREVERSEVERSEDGRREDERSEGEEEKPISSRERNEHWRTSIMARKAEAQRLVDACIFEKLPCRGMKDLFDQILSAMETGLSPEEILACCRRSDGQNLGLEIYMAMKKRGLKPA